MEEMFNMINRTIGQIEVDVIDRNSWPYRSGRVVDVSLTPPKEAEGMSHE